MKPKVQRLLIADDDIDDVELFLEAVSLVDSSIRCERAAHGEEAINILMTCLHAKPELIFLDLNMPVMNGYDCLGAIKNNNFFNNIPVVIYSTSNSKEHKEKAFALGALCFITKPDLFTEIKDVLTIIMTTPIDHWPFALREFKNVCFPESKFRLSKV